MPDSRGDGLRVAVLGPVRAWLADLELSLGPARQRTVFAVLATNAGRLVGRDELVEAVWGASAPSTATGSLYTYVSGLRRRLEPERSPWSAADLLTSGSTGYSLRLDPDGLDATGFARLRATAQRRLADADPAGAVAALDEALALWQGEAYSGVAGPFVELERQRLADLRLATIEQRARILLDAGGHEDLVAELTALVHDHPLDESLHELLMQALDRSGRHAEALAAYRQARQTLVRELGVEPGPALRRLHQRLLEDTTTPITPPRRPAPSPAAAPGYAGPPPSAAGPRPFVGRRAETQLLRTLAGDLAAGRGRAVWLQGPPGIGKSGLLAMTLSDVDRLGCRLARGAADPLGRRTPFRTLADCLDLDLEAGEPMDADAMVAAARDACSAAPLALVVDDAQWADDASLGACGRLVAETRVRPLLLVIAGRPSPQRPELARLRREVETRHGVSLAVGPLDQPDAEELIGRLLGASPGPTLRALARRTAGNPLHARVLAAALVRRAAVQPVDANAELDPTAADGVPRSLSAAARGILDLLSADAREMTRAAALLGARAATAELAALTGLRAAELSAALAEATGAQVLVDVGGRLAFAHPILRQATYEGIAKPLRATLRRHAAETLAGAGAAAIRVAEQLAAEPTVVDPWVLRWLSTHHRILSDRAPQLATELISRALASGLADARQQEALRAALAPRPVRTTAAR